MHYTPGTIVGLFGIAFLIWGVFESDPRVKKERMVRGAISLCIGIALFFVFSRS